MPRLTRLATLPATRRLVASAARSEAVRDLGRRALTDPGGIVRQVAHPGNPRELLGRASRHPAVQEVAEVGMTLLPFRFVPLGYAAVWAGRKVIRRYVGPSIDVLDEAEARAPRPVKDVTPG